MDNLEWYPGFIEEIGYGEYKKQILQYATVSILNIYNTKVI